MPIKASRLVISTVCLSPSKGPNVGMQVSQSSRDFFKREDKLSSPTSKGILLSPSSRSPQKFQTPLSARGHKSVKCSALDLIRAEEVPRRNQETPVNARSKFRERYHHCLERLKSEEVLSDDERRELEDSAEKMKRAAERRKMIVINSPRTNGENSQF
mmetsp:Transcript_7455/g.18304  ORF Transcript_7455/g.18304 Transcript_7455/m.18304 type:complete len:158 (-) Transcript_7455:58-531(-)